MKVLQVNSVCGYGSTGNIVVDLYHALQEQGHECCVAYGRGTVPENVKSYRIGSDLDVYVHAGLSRITDKQGFYSTKATKKFVKWIEGYNPDIIHLHNLHGYYMNIEVLFKALKKLDKLIVWTLHDCWAFTGHCSYYASAECSKWMSGCGHCKQKRQYPSSFLLDNSRENFEKKSNLLKGFSRFLIVTPSQWLAGEVRKSFLRDYPIQVIYNGIDLDLFKPTKGAFREKYQLEDKKVILGVANIWTERKGLHVFDDLAKKLDSTYKIVLIGITKKQAKQLDRRILCIERTENRKELAEIYTAADLFLNPSVEETMGLTTVEALACGTNVLVSNKTALPEIVNYNKKCLLQRTEIVSQIVELVEHFDEKERNMEVALQYEKKQQYMRYVQLYGLLCGNEFDMGRKRL